MRIWIINHYALPPTRAGGTRHYQFARQLIQRGHEVIIVAANYDHFSHTHMPLPGKLGEMDNTQGVPFIWIPTPAYKGNTIARFWNMLIFSWRILQKKYLPHFSPPDVIIGSSPHIFAAFSALLLSKKMKKPFVFEVRDIWPDTLVDLGRFTPRHPLIKIMKKMEHYLYKHAKRIISLLPQAKHYLTELGVDPKHIVWVPNAVDTEMMPVNMLPEPHAKFTLIYAGAHGLANDLETVISAARILQGKGLANQLQIYLVGDGPDKLRLKTLANEKGLTMVTFLDSVSKSNIYSILNKGDAYIMLLKPSPVFRWGISPNKLFDYFLMGRPVIFGVDTPFNPVEKYNAGITIKPSDPDALAQAMFKLSCMSKKQLHDMGKRGKDFVLKEHHMDKLTDKLESLVNEVSSDVIPNNTLRINVLPNIQSAKGENAENEPT